MLAGGLIIEVAKIILCMSSLTMNRERSMHEPFDHEPFDHEQRAFYA
jgi:hypothetical protein